MVEWNPVAGLRELTNEEIRPGDEIIRTSDHRTYTRWTIKEGLSFVGEGKSYLLSREIREPEGRGDLAEIYLKDSGSGEETVEMYVRTRPKFSDGRFSDEDAWTDEANELTRSWKDILNKVEDNKDYAIRTYTASYKEN